MIPRLLLAVCLVALVTAGHTASSESTAGPAREVVRGMTISCPGAGQIWGSDAMVETMAELKALGVNWVTIHPYASIAADGTVNGNRMSRLYRDTRWLTRPIEEAHRLGLKIMIKPHIAYWGSPFSWRGAIEFDNAAEWDRFFETYGQWIAMVAELSRDADAFVVGTELDRTIGHEAQWRRIIAAVREKTKAPLTYSANWDQYERVRFWDALDAIGIQAYFPLVGHELLPSEGELNKAWGRLVKRLDAYGERHDRVIVLAELGYNRSSQAAVRPWEYRTGGEHATETQKRCLDAALSAIEKSDRIVGAFLWKWFPGNPRRGNFLKSTPEMRAIIAARWREATTPQD
jgi:hypothetical protein